VVPLTDFEIDVLRRLTNGVLSSGELDEAILQGEFVGYAHTGWGYYFSFRHCGLPSARVVCNTPLLLAKFKGMAAGLLLFLESHEATLECHPWGDSPLSKDFRDHVESVRVLAPGTRA
jgi:hypothetical protein